MPSSCVSARRAEKTGKKKKAKPNQPESQPGAKPNQPESQPGAKPNQPEAKPNQPDSQPESQPEASQKPTKKKPARVSFEGANKGSCWAFCQTAYLGVIILQPHACTQRFRLQILCRTRSNAGRTSAVSLSGTI